MDSITSIIKAGLNTKNPRTANYLNQVKSSIVYKIAVGVLSILVMSIMVRYLGNEKYGIWSTLLTLISWMLYFDFGLATGTRNKVAESLANNEISQARIYVSTSYVVIGAICLCLFSGLLVVSRLINWQAFFNTKSIFSDDLRSVVLVISFFMLLNFVISIVQQLCHAVQKSSLTVLNQFLSNLFALLFIYVVTRISSGNLLYLGGAYGLALVTSNLVLSFAFYYKMPDLLPVLSCFQKRKIKELLGLGAKLFIIQLAVLVIFTTDKMLITQIFGPESITPYDISYKLFDVVIILQFIIVSPLWSTFTEAYIKKDFIWIKNILKLMILILIPFCFIIIFLIIFAQSIVNILIGGIIIPPSLLYMVGVFNIILLWCNIYAYFLQSCSKLYLSLVVSIFSAIINIPLSILFAKTFNFGLAGIFMGTIVSLLPGVILGPIQTYNIVNKRKGKIWNR